MRKLEAIIKQAEESVKEKLSYENNFSRTKRNFKNYTLNQYFNFKSKTLYVTKHISHYTYVF